MRHAHALAILVLAVLVAAAGVCSPSLAQTAVRSRARPQAPPAAASPDLTARPPQAAPASTAARLTLQGLPRRFDAAPACRAACAVTRVRCEAVDDACAPRWSACLEACAAA